MKELYVAQNGNDQAAGTLKAPLQTLAGVKEMITELVKSGEAINVIFRGGNYDMADTSVTFGEAESATESAPITFKAYKNEKPLFNCGIKLDLSKATKVTDEAIVNRIIDPYAQRGLYQLDVKDLVKELTSIEDSYGYNITSFTRNGQPMYPARFPKKTSPADSVNEETWLTTDYVVHSSENDFSHAPFTVYTELSVMDHIKSCWSKSSLNDLYIKGYLWHNWSCAAYKVDALDFENNTFTVNSGTKAYRYDRDDKKYRRFYFLNVLEELSDNNEYYIDKENGIFYFFPESLDDEIYFTKNKSPLITLDKASNYTFDGIAVSYSVFTPLVIKNSSNVKIENCEISHCNGDGAISAVNVPGFTLKNSFIYDLAASGVLLSNTGDNKTITSGNVLIEGNDMQNCGRSRKCYSPCLNTWNTIGTVIRNNKFHGNANMAVFMEGIDILFEYNEIYDAVIDSDDAGAIYWGRLAHSIGTVMRYNYFHDIGNLTFSTHGIGAIYTDDNATSAEIYGNVFHNAALLGDLGRKSMFVTMNATLFLNAAQFCNAHDNIFLMGTKGETPMSDVGHYAIEWWARNTLGAYVKNSDATLSQQQHWKEHLQAIGLMEGNNVSKLWYDHFKDTHWAPMFKLFTDENYLAGAVDANGKKYGIPDIQKKFENKEIDAATAEEMFNEYANTVVANVLGPDFNANSFNNNIIINMNPYFMVEKEHDSVFRTPHKNNMYISAKTAEEYFEDYKNADYKLTAKGKKAIADFMGNIDNPRTK